jgi:hypothetical protein
MIKYILVFILGIIFSALFICTGFYIFACIGMQCNCWTDWLNYFI